MLVFLFDEECDDEFDDEEIFDEILFSLISFESEVILFCFDDILIIHLFTYSPSFF